MKITKLTCAIAFSTVVAASAASVASAESTNSQTFEGWANDTAVKYNGRVPRDVYSDEMGRRWEMDTYHKGTRSAYLADLRTRWDRMDPRNQGLPPAEISQLTGKVDSSTAGMPMTGAGVQPGNMGPANAKGQ